MDNQVAALSKTATTEYEKMLKSPEYLASTADIKAPIGIQDNGAVVVAELSSIPHILVTGFSGSGKTAFVQSVMTELVNEYTTDQVQFLIYDGKRVDYASFARLPHLVTPIQNNQERMPGMFDWLKYECCRRLKVLSSAAAKDLCSFNAKNKAKSIPQLFVVLDDFSDIQLNDSQLQALLGTLKNGRVVGIHIIIVTSITSSKILKKELISNIPCRISFCVSSRADSRIAIEQPGAESPQVPSQLIFRWQNLLVKCQGIFLSQEHMVEVIKESQRKNLTNLDVLGNMAAQLFSTEGAVEQEVDEEYTEDDLLPNAVDIILETGQASVSMLQRRLKLGYARCARIMDQMEERGFVGPFDGAKPRAILITKAQWKRIQNGESATGEPDSDCLSSSQSRANTEATDDEKPDIPMRPFGKFSCGTSSIGVSDNMIRISKPVMTRLGSGTAYPSFNGKIVQGLLLHKAGLFSKGYMKFLLSDNINIENINPSLLEVKKPEISDFLTIEFSKSENKLVELLFQQISEDISIPIQII